MRLCPITADAVTAALAQKTVLPPWKESISVSRR
jgi:hypothetical protein